MFAYSFSPQYRLFIGNPGAGKSTLANCVANKLLFKSGVSFGEGMTYQLDKKVHNGITYLDTPGLADLKIREKAAAEITRALKQCGVYQVFFVITLESGRVRPEDVTTIKLVLESAIDIKHFSLVINKLSSNAYNRLFQNNAAQLKKLITELLVQINSEENPPTILLLKHQMKLYDQENQFMSWNELNEFVGKAPCINIRPSHVNDLKGDQTSFQHTLDNVNRQLEELRFDNLRLMRLQKETEESYQKLMFLNLLSLASQEETEEKKPKVSN